MRQETKAVILALVFGLLTWFIDAAVDYSYFRGGTYLGQLILDVSGHEIFMRSVTIALFIAFGTTIAWIMAHRRRAEQAWRESEERLATTLQSIGDAVIATDTTGRVAFMNPEAERLTGWPGVEAAGRPIDQVFPIVNETTRRPVENPVERVLREGVTVGLANHTVLLSRDGAELPIDDSGAPIKDASGNITGVVLVFHDVTGKRRAEAALRESEERFRRLAENAKDMIYRLSLPDGRCEYVSPAALELTGYTPEELYSSPSLIREMIHPDWRDYFEKEWQKLLAGEAPPTYEYQIRHKSGEIRWINQRNVLVRDEGGAPIALEAIATDSTERIKTQEALKASEERFVTFMNHCPALTFMKDREGRYIFANKAYQTILGVDPENRIGMTDEMLFPAEVAAALRENDRLVLSRNQALETMETITDADGRERIQLVYKFPVVNEGGESILGGIAMDVTDRVRTEEALRASEATTRALFELIPDMIFRFTADGTYTFYKPPTNFTPIAPPDVVGKNMHELMPKEMIAERMELIKPVLATGKMASHEYAIEVAGRIEYRQARYVRSGPDEVLAIVQDITDRIKGEIELRKLEEQLFQAQKMEAVGALAGGVAHDFNNVLQAISGYVQLMQLDLDESYPGSKNLKMINEAVERAAELVRQLLTFSRKTEIEFRPLDLNHEVRQAIGMLKRTIPKMIDIEVRLADDLKPVNGDSVQLEQVLINLGTNAADAMPEGGRLLIETESVVLDDSYTAVHLEAEPGEYVLLKVSDTGCGMDKETLQRIFEPFFTTKEVGQGTGLGLSTVYGIVKGHGGHITCYSEPGQGTVFNIYLPAWEQSGNGRTARTEFQMGPIRGDESILLVDDEEAVAGVAEKFLRRYGYSVLTASSGEEALEIYRARGEAIDLVVLDLGMPGMGGRKCLEELLKLDPQAKVIVASGYSINGQAADVIESGARGFLSKPYRLSDMLKKVREVLDRD